MDEQTVRWKKWNEVYIPPLIQEGFATDIIIRERVPIVPLIPVIEEFETKAFIEREKTKERIELNKSLFIIGKERKKVDYQILGNTAISRTHISIEKRFDGYYLRDLNSLNHTYVEGQEIRTEFKLENRTRILLADEYFTFSII